MSEQKHTSGGGVSWSRLLKKLSPYTIQKGFRYLKHYGWKEFWVRLQERFEPEEIPYGPWYEEYRPGEDELKRQRAHCFPHAPLISLVVPAYHTPEKFLREMIDSLKAQTYGNWELCLANGSPGDAVMEAVLEEIRAADGRVRYENLKSNEGIAGNTNAAFAMAQGEFIGLLDHDDLLSPNALFEVIRVLNAQPDADVIYTDEDKVTMDLSEHFQPHFKPDFNLDLLRSNNYICHFFVVRRSIVERVGGFRPAYDGAQDYDFIFRCTEEARKICHVPEILYHWRTHKASTADNPASKMYAFEAGRRAIEAHLERVGERGNVTHTKDYGFYRVKYPVQGEPLVSIVIPNREEKDTLKACLDSIKEKTTYGNYEIIIIENNSTSREIFDYYEELQKDSRIRVVRWEREFNYSAINNYGTGFARGDYLLFLNNDVTVITKNWLEELLGICQRPNVGACGVRLYYPDDTVQHGGVIVGMGGIAGNVFTDMPRERTGYLHKAALLQDLSAVTAACVMMKKEVFLEVGGFTEELAVAFNDVDLCLKMRRNGYLIVYNPFVELYHMESKSRGTEDSKEKVRRFQSEIEYMRCHWLDILKGGDPYYNKNLSLTKWNYSLRPHEKSR